MAVSRTRACGSRGSGGRDRRQLRRHSVPEASVPTERGVIMNRFVFAGGTAVVTGAASGIGEALAHALAHRGSDLVLLDRDGDRLQQVVAAIRGSEHSVRVTAQVVDLADAGTTADVAEAIMREHPRIRLLVN